MVASRYKRDVGGGDASAGARSGGNTARLNGRDVPFGDKWQIRCSSNSTSQPESPPPSQEAGPAVDRQVNWANIDGTHTRPAGPRAGDSSLPLDDVHGTAGAGAPNASGAAAPRLDCSRHHSRIADACVEPPPPLRASTAQALEHGSPPAPVGRASVCNQRSHVRC